MKSQNKSNLDFTSVFMEYFSTSPDDNLFTICMYKLSRLHDITWIQTTHYSIIVS